jgi:hypothetical protein
MLLQSHCDEKQGMIASTNGWKTREKSRRDLAIKNVIHRQHRRLANAPTKTCET